MYTKAGFLLESLEAQALWIIMDPWETTPYEEDLVRCPDLDSLNQIISEKIVKHLPRLKHVTLSCAEYNGGKQTTVLPSLSHLTNLKHDFTLLKEYVDRHSIRNIVYMGFHHGACIIDRPIGAAAVRKEMSNINLWLKRDLVGILPWHNEEYADSKALQYMKFI